MPRYDLSTAALQAEYMVDRWRYLEMSSIPLLDSTCYKFIVDLDCQRMGCKECPEVRKPVLRETINGMLYEYKQPRKALPIDRKIERCSEERNKELRAVKTEMQVVVHHQRKNVQRPIRYNKLKTVQFCTSSIVT
jgi:hypothetical protein